jgi:hypothetical protein
MSFLSLYEAAIVHTIGFRSGGAWVRQRMDERCGVVGKGGRGLGRRKQASAEKFDIPLDARRT